ncbi:MAG: hypothetical protein U5Q16_13670 [Gammaproteobacteria bacterium]|nr:hypothetical protein [Gammaproteobacteria bacterium]
MRYLLQLLIPLLIFAGVVYLLTRRRKQPPTETGAQPEEGSDTPAFLTILAISAVVALGTAYALITLWE